MRMSKITLENLVEDLKQELDPELKKKMMPFLEKLSFILHGLYDEIEVLQKRRQ